MKHPARLNRRSFLKRTTALGVTVIGSNRTIPDAEAHGGQTAARRIKVGVIGCGSVSRKYLPDLASSPHVELVSVCDIVVERARRAARRQRVPHSYSHIDELLAGAHFELLVNLTDMQAHYGLNRKALAAGKHVWSEKPLAGSYEQGRELVELAEQRRVRLLGAPTVVTSPQFSFMARTLAKGTLGRVAAAHAAYGHLGPSWSPFFYEKGGGSLFDLGVYNVATLTGLLGPAREVVAMTGVVTPARKVAGRQIAVEAEDNTMLIMRHAGGALSHVQCGFNYFSAREHSSTDADHHTIDIIGTGGSLHLAGYDWAPHGVDLATRSQPRLTRHATDAGTYTWQYGASLMAESLATNKPLLIATEHVLHVVEVMAAVHRSQETGERIKIESRFRWPIVS